MFQKNIYLNFLLYFFLSANVFALESDREQSVLVEAEEVEMDFNSGVRIYRGNVSVEQGTIRIIADEIQLFYKGEQLDHAIAKGDPAIFRQRPDNKDHDIVGTGQTIKLDEINNLVTFLDNARLRQDRDSIEGEKIVYDMARDRMIVRGTKDMPTLTKRSDKNSKDNITGSRPRLSIQPNQENDASSTLTTQTNLQKNDDSRYGYIKNEGTIAYLKKNTDSKKIGKLIPDTPVKIDGIFGDWIEARVASGLGAWIYGKYVSTNQGIGIVTGSQVRLRTDPSTEKHSHIVGIANPGEKLFVLSVKGKWKYVKTPTNLKIWILKKNVIEASDIKKWKNNWALHSK